MTNSTPDRFHDTIKGLSQDRTPIFPMIAARAAANVSDWNRLNIMR